MSDIMKLLEAVAIRLQAKTTQEAFMSVIKIKEIAEQQLAAAHRAGWEQAKREAYSLSQQHSLLSSTKSGEIEINELAIAIAVMEYKEKSND